MNKIFVWASKITRKVATCLHLDFLTIFYELCVHIIGEVGQLEK